MLLCRYGTQDSMVCREVLDDNEYRLPDAFAAEDLIIDVGAHIGAFAVACLERGAGMVHAYEPVEENYRLCRMNLPTARTSIRPLAVWHQAGHLALRTLAVPYTAMFSAADGVEAELVGAQAVTLKEVLEGHKVRLLKLDCEGAEVPILESASAPLLADVQEVVGELHYVLRVPGFPRATNEWAKETLGRLGFDEVITRRNPRSPLMGGMFWARRRS